MVTSYHTFCPSNRAWERQFFPKSPITGHSALGILGVVVLNLFQAMILNGQPSACFIWEVAMPPSCFSKNDSLGKADSANAWQKGACDLWQETANALSEAVKASSKQLCFIAYWLDCSSASTWKQPITLYGNKSEHLVIKFIATNNEMLARTLVSQMFCWFSPLVLLQSPYILE